MKAVRFKNSGGEIRIGALADDGTITDAGAAGPQGFIPTELGWEAVHHADGPSTTQTMSSCCTRSCPTS